MCLSTSCSGWKAAKELKLRAVSLDDVVSGQLQRMESREGIETTSGLFGGFSIGGLQRMESREGIETLSTTPRAPPPPASCSGWKAAKELKQ